MKIRIWCAAQPREAELSADQVVTQVVPLLQQCQDSAEIAICPLDAPIAIAPQPQVLDYSLTHWAASELWQQCQALPALVTQWGIRTSTGGLYQLPLAQTAKGTLFGEIIGCLEGTWQLPIHASDRQRQTLYDLGRRLLDHLQAPVGCYFLQFGWQGEVIFEQLWPFPTVAALASIGVQTPDWLTAHYQCLRGIPLRDVRIPARDTVRRLE
ncbi:hypothetical protein RHP47_05135 [Thermosynechococcus sp. QKsg1]|uniref:hypothetical protein n=1 Tax=unclassified Thermosynechococcus TaxID=2622553 RepID=UPI002577CD25|nr:MULTISPECIES: hypothetical protein [unclassified Thermosynechococcus]WJI25066.1 hypothetical protein MZ909_05140 [Thermosynechococcus sp. B0]WNC87710.1 hypothetical protein RHP47_05135 [Thermosynechococcus sp. QKsg1]